jgi:multiple antibiotic resistance protein
MEMVAFFVHALVSVFAVMNPLGMLPTFMALTSGSSKARQRQVARKAILNSFIILLVFLLLGNVILHMFSITIAAFRVAGGILLFGIAYNLLNAKQSHIQTPYESESHLGEDITMTPLAIPIIAGPGTITSVMALAAGPEPMIRSSVVLVAFTIVLLAAFTIFYYAAWIHERMTQAQVNVITRLMGFILSIIAIQMAANGLTGLFPRLVHM